MPLSTLRHGKKRWTPVDRALALALTVHEDGLCSGCGQPRDRSWNEDMEGQYKAHRVLCQGCNAAHLAKDAHALSPAESMFVAERKGAPEVPDPRMAPKFVDSD